MYKVIDSTGRVPIKAWIEGVSIEAAAEAQLKAIATLPFVYHHVAVMPDVHLGKGATVGSVVPTRGALIPAALGVDIACGMDAVRLNVTASQLPDDLKSLRCAIEEAVPHGFSSNSACGHVRGTWNANHLSFDTRALWFTKLNEHAFNDIICTKHRIVSADNPNKHVIQQLGTLGGGNHFIEICIDDTQEQHVWIMLHSGSRGVGNKIGTHFTRLARDEMKRWFIDLVDPDLAYLVEGTSHFEDYWKAVMWAQTYASINRQLMMNATLKAVASHIPHAKPIDDVISCHHNYASIEHHFGNDVYVTRKGAIRARVGDLGIIPGSMGTKSFIVRGKGNPDSFCSCSHGAGRSMSRSQARKRFTIDDHIAATKHVECRKDEDVIDETPSAYKDIDAVIAAEADLIDVVTTLSQVVCVKG